MFYQLYSGGSIYTQQHVEIGSKEIINKLEKLREEIDITTKNNERGKMIDKSKSIYSKWEKTSKSWSIIVLHDELDMVETSLIRMKSAIETDSLEKAIEELDISIALLKHISEKETFSLRNVF